MKLSIPAALLLTAGVALGMITFDPSTGTGFVGKGDVQLVYGWNDQQLQANAEAVEFRYQSTETVSWTCYKDGDITKQDQTRTRTQGVNGDVLRELRKNGLGKVTGFNLTGWDGEATEVSAGPPYHSCPNFWEIIGEDEVSSSGQGLEVSKDNTNWYGL